jgi:putative ABC transport system permease protein
MNYALATLWHERSRFLPGVLAVAFSAVLIALQCGLLLGLFSITSLPIDNTRSDIWIGSKEVKSVDLGRPIPKTHMSRLGAVEGVERESIEFYYQAFANWKLPDGSSELCLVVGSKLDDGSMGTVQGPNPGEGLTQELRFKLAETDGVAIDFDDKWRLGITEVGQTAEINNHKVRVVGFVRGYKSLAGPYVFCSDRTARKVLAIVVPPDHCTYLLARVKGADDDERRRTAQKIVAELRQRYDDMASFTSWDFSVHSRMHWLTKTKAGIAIGYAALLGLLVGMVVTSQTLYAATMASAREYAILLALGIPRGRIYSMVLAQSFWVGLFGVLVAYPSVKLLARGAALLGVNVKLPWELLAGAAAITLVMAMISGLLALRSVRRIEPMNLLR